MCVCVCVCVCACACARVCTKIHWQCAFAALGVYIAVLDDTKDSQIFLFAASPEIVNVGPSLFSLIYSDIMSTHAAA